MDKIVAVDRNYKGDIISFKTSTGRVISYRKALQEMDEGILTSVHMTINQDSEEHHPVSFLSIEDVNQVFENYPPI